MEQVIQLNRNEHACSILDEMNRLKQEREHCDFTIKVGSEAIPVHKHMLAASSPYFKAMLSHDNVETHSGVVEIKKADVECVKKCINFIYTGTASVSKEKRSHLMHVAHMLQLQRLCDGLGVFLESSLNADTFFSTKNIADMYSCKDLENKCNKFAVDNFRVIAKMDEFRLLEGSYVELLIKSKENEVSESFKCSVLIDWTMNDLKNRERFFRRILGNLDLTKMSLSYRRYLVDDVQLVNGSTDCLSKVSLSILHEVKGQDYKSVVEEKTIGLFDSTSKYMMAYHPADKTCKNIAPWNQEMIGQHSFTCVVLDDALYVLLPNKTCFQLYLTDVDAGWKQVAQRTLTGTASAVLGGFIYAGETASPSVAMERYDALKNEWERIPDKTQALAHSTLVADSTHLYVIGGYCQRLDYVGGYHSNVSVSNVERFDPIYSSWSQENSMNQARDSAAAVALDGCVYVLGGRQQYQQQRNMYNSGVFQASNQGTAHTLSSTECHDPSNGTWTNLMNMPSPMSNFSACIISGNIFIVGGDSIQKWNIGRNKWEPVEKMSGRNFGKTAIVVL